MQSIAPVTDPDPELRSRLEQLSDAELVCRLLMLHERTRNLVQTHVHSDVLGDAFASEAIAITAALSRFAPEQTAAGVALYEGGGEWVDDTFPLDWAD